MAAPWEDVEGYPHLPLDVGVSRYSFKSSSQTTMGSWTETDTAFEPMSPPNKEVESSTTGDSGKEASFHDIGSNAVVPCPEARPLWSRVREYGIEGFSEFFGTMILVLFGDGVVAQVLLSHGQKGDYQSISWGWGIGVMLGVYTSGASGAHINPAVTFANCIFRQFPWRKFPIYILSQVLGAMCGAAVVYGNYKSAIDSFEGGPNKRTVPGYSSNATAGIFCTYPAEFMTRTGQFFSEFLASAILMFMIFALKDDNNLGAGKLMPLGLFFVVFGIGACFGWETGYAINLARDFGPRLVSYMIGYGHEVWKAGNYYFWVPMVAPFVGCLFGGLVYDIFLYTGEDSPINMRWVWIMRLVSACRQKKVALQSHV